MNQFIQALESRQMFSAAPVVPHIAVSATPAVPHLSVMVNQTMYFQGTSLNSDGSLDADLLMTLKPAGKGYTADVLVCNPSGKITTVHLVFNAAGQFTYRDSGDGDGTTVVGQLSSDRQTITAAVTHNNAGVITTGTVSCSRTTTAPTETNYIGTMGSGDKHMGLKGTLVKTSTGYFGVLAMVTTNPNSNNGGLFITLNSTGAFTAGGTADGNPTLLVTGQLSANGKVLAGTFSGLNIGTATIGGPFSLVRT